MKHLNITLQTAAEAWGIWAAVLWLVWLTTGIAISDVLVILIGLWAWARLDAVLAWVEVAG